MSYSSTLPLPSGPSTSFSHPLANPDPSSVPPPPRPSHTPEQQLKLTNLITHFNSPSFSLPSTLKELKTMWKLKTGTSGRSFVGGLLFGKEEEEPEPVLKELDEKEKCYWSQEAFTRCLRATKWDYEAAVKRAESTLVWRREFGTEDLSAERVSKEGETGKELMVGYDINFRPVLYMHPYRQNTQTGPGQIEFVVWCLERAIDLCPPTVPVTDMICLCIDFGANLPNNKSQPTSVGQAKKVLDILQTYYCERLGRAICINMPSIFWAFYKLVGPFVDPATKEKIRFIDNADATSLIPPSQLQTMFGGEIKFDYDHATYFPSITSLCAERKAANLERWKKYGDGKCGLSEAVIRGAVVPGVEGKEGLMEEEEEEEEEVVVEEKKVESSVEEVTKGVEGVRVEA